VNSSSYHRLLPRLRIHEGASSRSLHVCNFYIVGLFDDPFSNQYGVELYDFSELSIEEDVGGSGRGLI
jgi:hypothetical protein